NSFIILRTFFFVCSPILGLSAITLDTVDGDTPLFFATSFIVTISSRLFRPHFYFLFNMSQFHKSITEYKIRTIISASEWLSLQADAVRGHGLRLLTREIRSLWGLRTRAARKLVANKQCCSRDEQDVLVSSVGHRTSPVLADQESPPYVTAIRVRFLNTNGYHIYL